MSQRVHTEAFDSVLIANLVKMGVICSVREWDCAVAGNCFGRPCSPFCLLVPELQSLVYCECPLFSVNAAPSQTMRLPSYQLTQSFLHAAQHAVLPACREPVLPPASFWLLEAFGNIYHAFSLPCQQIVLSITHPFSQRKRAHYYATSIADTALFLKRYFAALFDGSYYMFLFNIILKFLAFYKLF